MCMYVKYLRWRQQQIYCLKILRLWPETYHHLNSRYRPRTPWRLDTWDWSALNIPNQPSVLSVDWAFCDFFSCCDGEDGSIAHDDESRNLQ